jgi:asparagine synthase (glutamine-hydrolysing)
VNLFVIVWCGWADLRRSAHSALDDSLSTFTQLDPVSVKCDGTRDPTFIAMSQTPSPAALPRVYTHQCESGITFYSGLPVDPTGQISAHRARDLHEGWETRTGCLEGQYCLVHFLHSPLSLEIQTDPLGLEQIYYSRSGNAWVLSNNATIVARTFGLSTFDPLGVSLALSMGWVGADRTLLERVRVLQGGQKWRFSGPNEPEVQTYFSVKTIARYRPSSTHPDIERLHQPANALVLLSREFGELLCPLTGGRDSRVNAALLRKTGVLAQYFTSGTKNSPDAIIARRVAKTLQKPCELDTITTREIVSEWDSLANRLIGHTDGLVSLWQIADVFYHRPRIQKLRVSVTGIGGEIARGYYSDNDVLQRTATKRMTCDYLCDKLLYQGNLLSPDVITMAKQFINTFVEECRDNRVPGVNIPDVFYADERVRRWAGSNCRKNGVLGDRYSFFCSREFVTTAFRVTAQSRVNESIHRAILANYAPALLEIPFDDGELWGLIGRPCRLTREPHYRQQALWLSALRPKFCEMVLDLSKTSAIWKFISRPNVERFILAPRRKQMEQHRSIVPFFTILTIVYFEASSLRQPAMAKMWPQ